MTNSSDAPIDLAASMLVPAHFFQVRLRSGETRRKHLNEERKLPFDVLGEIFSFHVASTGPLECRTVLFVPRS